jgi:hypothetical protein
MYWKSKHTRALHPNGTKWLRATETFRGVAAELVDAYWVQSAWDQAILRGKADRSERSKRPNGKYLCACSEEEEDVLSCTYRGGQSKCR